MRDRTQVTKKNSPLRRQRQLREDQQGRRDTLARWVIACSELLVPLHNVLRDHLLSQDVLHMDETPVQVLKEDGRTAQSQSYMWVQSGGPPREPVVLFDYDPSRSGAPPARLLEGYRGYLMTKYLIRVPQLKQAWPHRG